MREQHLDFLPLATRDLIRLGLGEVANQLACAFMDLVQRPKPVLIKLVQRRIGTIDPVEHSEFQLCHRVIW